MQVSVVIPAYNAARTVRATLASVLRQSHPVDEVLVVDDGSTDETPRLAAGWGGPVRLLSQARQGPAAARNAGAAAARGSHVAFLDADDLWLPEKLARQAHVFAQQPGVAAVQTGAYLVDEALRVLETRRCRPAHDRVLDFLLLRNLPAFSSTVLVRKDAFLAIGGFATDLVMETWDMACRLARYGGLRSVPECLVLYRQHEGNRSRQVEAHRDTGLRALTRFLADPTLEPGIRQAQPEVWARFYAMLAGGYWRNGALSQSAAWAWRALRASPRVAPYVLGMPWRQLQRRWDPAYHRSFAGVFPDAAGTDHA